MHARQTWLLAALAAGLFAFIYFFERHQRPPAPVIVKALPGLRPSDVTSLQIQASGTNNLEIRLVRTNGGWLITKPIVYPAQSAVVEQLLQGLAELSPLVQLSAQELSGGRHLNEDFGLGSPPRLAVILQQGEDTPRELILGNLTAPGDAVYSQTVGLTGVNVLGLEILKLVPVRLDQLMDPVFCKLADAAFDRVTVTNGPKAFELQFDPADKLWRLSAPMKARADNAKITQLLAALQDIQVLRFETSADADTFGLQPPALDLGFWRGTNRLAELQFGKTTTNTPAAVYARRAGQPIVMLVPREPLAAWYDELSEFRDQHLLCFDTGFPDVVEMPGTPDGFTVRQITNDAWRVTAPLDFPAGTNVMRDFIGGMAVTKIVRTNGQFAVKDVVPDSDLPQYGLAPPQRRYLFSRSTGGPTNRLLAEIDFGAVTSGGTVFARRTDESSVYAVRVADFNRLPASVLDLHDRSVENFEAENVTQLLVRKDGRTNQFIHTGPNRWQMGAGMHTQGVFDELALQGAVMILSTLEAAHWVARGEAERKKFGIGDNGIQLMVEIARPGAPREKPAIDLGGMSPHGLRYGGARMPDGDYWIFEFPSDVMAQLSAYLNLDERAGP